MLNFDHVSIREHFQLIQTCALKSCLCNSLKFHVIYFFHHFISRTVCKTNLRTIQEENPIYLHILWVITTVFQECVECTAIFSDI